MELINREEIRERAGFKKARGNVACKKGRVISMVERKARHERAQNTPGLDQLRTYSPAK